MANLQRDKEKLTEKNSYLVTENEELRRKLLKYERLSDSS